MVAGVCAGRRGLVGGVDVRFVRRAGRLERRGAVGIGSVAAVGDVYVLIAGGAVVVVDAVVLGDGCQRGGGASERCATLGGLREIP